jgi:hypothetical protein
VAERLARKRSRSTPVANVATSNLGYALNKQTAIVIVNALPINEFPLN